jgi:dTMP kinase
MTTYARPEILEEFWVLEGLDGSGTTTQLSLLGKLADLARARLHRTCEPTRGEIGRFVRTLLGKGGDELLPATMAWLFFADRFEHINGKGGVRERITQGFRVLSDRYLLSSLAYQSLHMDFDRVWDLNRALPLPVGTFFIDTPPRVCDERIKKRNAAREMYENLDILIAVREGYLRGIELVRSFGSTVYVIDGELLPEQIRDSIWAIMEKAPIT